MYTIGEDYKRCKRLGALITSEGSKVIYEISDTIDPQRFKKVYKSLDELFEAIELITLIDHVALKNKFNVKNADKIINAKMRFFAGGDLKRCPCDANNPLRYCGSEQCIADVKKDGHCHCNLFCLEQS